MGDLPGSNSLNNLQGLTKETYSSPGMPKLSMKGMGKPRGKYTKIKAMMEHLKKGEPIKE
jgi:hypothetical protein